MLKLTQIDANTISDTEWLATIPCSHEQLGYAQASKAAFERDATKAARLSFLTLALKGTTLERDTYRTFKTFLVAECGGCWNCDHLLSAYLKHPLDQVLGGLSVWWRQRSETRQRDWAARVDRLKESEEAKNRAVASEVRMRLQAIHALLLAIFLLVVPVFILTMEHRHHAY